jgi:hypothetical protein
MTLEEYLALITSYHSTRPRFVNTVAALVQPMVAAMAMLQHLTIDFDLDTAIGVQLDMVGQWLGRDRYLKLPVTNVFFSFDDWDGPDTGFDKGVWQGKYDARDQVARLDDETYRMILKLQAIANQWTGEVPPIVIPFDDVFPGVVMDDRGDKPGGLMACDVLIPGPEITKIMLYVLEQDFALKASGVRYNFIETTVTTDPLFGFDIDNNTIAGFDRGAWGKIILST